MVCGPKCVDFTEERKPEYPEKNPRSNPREANTGLDLAFSMVKGTRR